MTTLEAGPSLKAFNHLHHLLSQPFFSQYGYPLAYHKISYSRFWNLPLSNLLELQLHHMASLERLRVYAIDSRLDNPDMLVMNTSDDWHLYKRSFLLNGLLSKPSKNVLSLIHEHKKWSYGFSWKGLAFQIYSANFTNCLMHWTANWSQSSSKYIARWSLEVLYQFQQIQISYYLFPRNTWNMDEHGIGVCTNSIVPAEAGKKHTYVSSSQNPEWVSIVKSQYNRCSWRGNTINHWSFERENGGYARLALRNTVKWLDIDGSGIAMAKDNSFVKLGQGVVSIKYLFWIDMIVILI